MRSDKIEHLHSYKDVAGLSGIFTDSRRIESLDRQAAGAVIETVFESKDYRLDRGCIRRILDDASSSPQRRGKPFLPYLQLLASRFFEWLEERHRQVRGYDETIRVVSQDYLEFSGKGRLMDAFFREAIMELLLFEPDRHLVLKIFSLLIEGDRRRLVGKQEIRAALSTRTKSGSCCSS